MGPRLYFAGWRDRVCDRNGGGRTAARNRQQRPQPAADLGVRADCDQRPDRDRRDRDRSTVRGMAMIGDALRISRLALVAAVDRFAIWIVLLALLALATTLSDAFLRPAYLGNVVRQLAPVGTAAVGATFVMILGGIDLSVGAVISLAVVICAVQMDGQIANIPWALCVTLLTGAGIGLVNGLLAAFSRASPFILTLGTSLAVYGLTQIYSGGTARGIVAPQFREFFNYRIGGVMPVLGLMFLIMGVIAVLMLRLTRLGRSMYLIGSNPRAARISGLPIRAVTLVGYVLSGVLAALGGIALLARSGVSSTF